MFMRVNIKFSSSYLLFNITNIQLILHHRSPLHLFYTFIYIWQDNSVQILKAKEKVEENKIMWKGERRTGVAGGTRITPGAGAGKTRNFS